MRFWISWYQPTEDMRPVYDPKKEPAPFKHRYWCSGERMDPFALTICAVVEAVSESEAFRLVQKYWPEAEELRFCEAKADNWLPDSGRFPTAKKENSMVTGEQVKAAALAVKLDRISLHECAICGVEVAYRVCDGDLYFDPACGCSYSLIVSAVERATTNKLELISNTIGSSIADAICKEK